jgi:ABC-2 type transport system ATP-binding protein
VALALALLNDPALLFLDEPTTGLDPQVRHEIHGFIQELKESRRTIVITTHYIEEAERLCDRVAIIDSGKIIELGSPREIQQRVLGLTLVEITTDQPIPIDELPEKVREERYVTRNDGRLLSMQTDSPAAAIVELVKWIDQHGLKLLDIHLKRPTLEDVFIELTGKRLRE